MHEWANRKGYNTLILFEKSVHDIDLFGFDISGKIIYRELDIKWVHISQFNKLVDSGRRERKIFNFIVR